MNLARFGNLLYYSEPLKFQVSCFRKLCIQVAPPGLLSAFEDLLAHFNHLLVQFLAFGLLPTDYYEWVLMYGISRAAVLMGLTCVRNVPFDFCRGFQF